jgi:hypothetical protein
MDANKFLKTHTIPSGDFTKDVDIAGIIGTLITHGFENTCNAYIHNEKLLARCPTAQLFNQFLEGRAVYIIDKDGKMFFKGNLPTNQEIFNGTFGETK